MQRALLWPIANIGQDGWEGPELDPESGEIVSWHAGWLERKFPVDMNAFCFHTSYLLVRVAMLSKTWFLHDVHVLCMLHVSSQSLTVLCEYHHPSLNAMLHNVTQRHTGRGLFCNAAAIRLSRSRR